MVSGEESQVNAITDDAEDSASEAGVRVAAASVKQSASPTGDSYVWSGPITGSWNVAANWTDVSTDQDPAPAPRGANDTVTINGVANGTEVINGMGAAASLTANGAIDFTGPLTLGAFALGSPT